MRLEGKVAIVAGAAWGGIGAATAYRFACEGCESRCEYAPPRGKTR